MVIDPNDVERLTDDVRRRYPYPLAAAFLRAFYTTYELDEMLEYLVELFELVVKYLAGIAVSQYLAGPLADPQISESLLNLRRPSLGHWQGWLRDIPALHGRLQRAFNVPELVAFYNQKDRDRLLGAYKDLFALPQMGGDQRNPTSVTMHQFFEGLGTYRNRLAHGSRPSRQDRERAAQILVTALHEIFHKLAFLADYRLVYVAQVTVEFDSGSPRYSHALTNLMGDSPRVTRPVTSSAMTPNGRIYLLDKTQEFHSLLSLHPFLIYQYCERCGREQTFWLNAADSDGVDYLGYPCSHRYRPDRYFRDVRLILDRLTLAEADPLTPAGPPTPPSEEFDPHQEPISPKNVDSKDPPILSGHGNGQSARLIDENVQFTVYRPRVVQPRDWNTLLAFAHLSERRPEAGAQVPDPIEQVKQQARQVLGEHVNDYQQVAQDSQQGVPREGELTFVPEIPGMEFNPPRRSFLWLEDVHREEFRFRADVALEGQMARGRLSVFLGSILLAEVSLNIRVDRRTLTDAVTAVDNAQPYRRIFAAYSSKDVAIVQEFVRFAQATGDRYLQDVIHSRSEEVWNDRLTQLIDSADVFQLFWSSNSMRSPFIRQEWERALALKRPNFIRPIYWEEPLPESPSDDLPPFQLQRLHFHRVYPAWTNWKPSRVPVGTDSAGADSSVASPSVPDSVAPLPPGWATPSDPDSRLTLEADSPYPDCVSAPRPNQLIRPVPDEPLAIAASPLIISDLTANDMVDDNTPGWSINFVTARASAEPGWADNQTVPAPVGMNRGGLRPTWSYLGVCLLVLLIVSLVVGIVEHSPGVLGVSIVLFLVTAVWAVRRSLR